MKSSKKLFIMIGIVYAIVFAVINLLIFVIFKTWTKLIMTLQRKHSGFQWIFNCSVLLNFASLFHLIEEWN